MTIAQSPDTSKYSGGVEQYQDFLSLLFGPDPLLHPLVLFMKKGKNRRSLWCSSIQEAVRHVVLLSPSNDTYVAVAQHDKKVAEEEWKRRKREKGEKVSPHSKPSTRGFTISARVLCGVHGDIDIKGPAHIEGRLPATKEEALAFIASLPIPPTLIIDTGWGFHCWWLFKEPWVLESVQEVLE